MSQAHALERSALQTRKDVPPQPSAVTAEKHQTAAAEFSKATQGIGDYEALRVLRLLEEHHRKLAAIVKDAGNERQSREVQSAEDEDTERKDTVDEGESVENKSSGSARRKAAEEKKASGPQQEASEADASGDKGADLDNGASADPTTQKSKLPPQTSKEPPESATSPRSRRTAQQGSTKTKTSTSPNAQRKLVRESSSSIAGNLASARGIPTVQQKEARRALRQSQQVLGAGPGQGTSTKDSEKEKSAEWTASSPSPSQKDDPAHTNHTDEKPDKRPFEAASAGADQSVRSNTDSGPEMAEDPFNKFYTTFNGLISKISAPLAFAGLPLTSDSETPTSDFFTSSAPSTPRSTAQHAQPPTKQDTEDTLISKVYSKAALRALHSDERNPTPRNMHESFYIVPHSGGTVSYANILSHRRSDTQSDVHPPNLQQEPSDHFVDARESQRRSSTLSTDAAGAAATRMLTPSRGAASPGVSTKTLEELTLENASLKQLTDNLSKRLYMWERDSQRQTEAMRASMRYMSSSQHQQKHPPPDDSTTTPPGSPSKPSDAHSERMSELEERLARSEREAQRSARENEKLKTVVGRYREKWEKLKEGARTRREGECGGCGAGGSGERSGIGRPGAGAVGGG